MEHKVRIPVDRPPPGAAHHTGTDSLRDVLARYRTAAGGDAPPKLGPAILQARREQLLDNAIELDAALRELAVAALLTMDRIREACPEIVNRGGVRP